MNVVCLLVALQVIWPRKFAHDHDGVGSDDDIDADDCDRDDNDDEENGDNGDGDLGSGDGNDDKDDDDDDGNFFLLFFSFLTKPVCICVCGYRGVKRPCFLHLGWKKYILKGNR